MRRIPPLAFVAAALAAALPTGSARANGRFPTSGYVVVGPGPGSSIIALRTTFGVVSSYDGGRRWGWTCEEAFGGVSGYDPSLAIGSLGTVAATVPMGIAVGTGPCAWSAARGTPTRNVVDITVDATGRVMFSAIGPTGTDDTIFRSTDGGLSWESRAMLPGFFTETIEVAPSDPTRVYVSGFLRGGIPVLYRSDDGGMSVREVTRDFGRGGSAFISGVDPTNPDVVYVRSSMGLGTILLRSTDGGATLREVGSTADTMAGFALSDDGSTVWIGSVNRAEGLLRSVRGAPFRRVGGNITIRCLRQHAGVLYVCADELADGYLLGCSTDGGERIDPLLSGRSLLGVSDRCDDTTSVARACNSLWPPVRMSLAAIDAGPIPTPVPHDATVDATDEPAVATDATVEAATDAPADAPAVDATDEPAVATDATVEAATDAPVDAPAVDATDEPAVAADATVEAATDAPADAPAPDGPSFDGTARPDGGSGPPPPPARDCACRGAPTEAPSARALLAVAALASLRRRRRRGESQ